MNLHRGSNVISTVISLVLLASLTEAALADALELRVRADRPGDTISRYLYGQFAENLGRGIYEGIWVGEGSDIPNTRGFRDDVIAALKRLHIPVIRWPGGCFADEYHWRDGIGPRDERPIRINKSWGWVEDGNAFGTHEFLEFAEMLGSDAYIAGNIGSGGPQEMADWLEYMTEDKDSSLARLRRENGRNEPWKVAFFGIGNESWGCGGSMTPDFYAHLYKRYATFLKAPAGNQPKRIASGGFDGDTVWTDTLSTAVARSIGSFFGMDGISHHFYTFPSGSFFGKGRATGFPENEWISTLANALKVDDHIAANTAVLDKNDPDGKIGIYLDEWGTWYDRDEDSDPSLLWQQNTIRDALVAALHFNVFHRHADRLHMANIAQTVNVLQAMVLTEGRKILLTPTYHAFEMYVPFQDSTFVPVEYEQMPEYALEGVSVPHVSAAAAISRDGDLVVALVNLHAEDSIDVSASIRGFEAAGATGRVLTGSAIDAHNNFNDQAAVAPVPLEVRLGQGEISGSLPPRSVSVITLRRPAK
jgi:alpha-N-arabinofuranosidase